MAPARPAVKRKSSSAGLSLTSGRAVKRRASKACSCCRARKVRCDVVESGTPCTNCRLDEVGCVVSDSRRKKKSPGDSDTLEHSPNSSVEEVDDLPQFSYADDIDGFQDISLDGMLGGNMSSTLDFELSHHTPHMIYQTQGHRLTQEERKRRLSSMSQIAAPSLPPPIQSIPVSQCFPRPSMRPATQLPVYVRPLPPRILRDDVEYLDQKGALTVPDMSLRNELLRSYAQYVHPYMPLLDLEDFLNPIEQNDGGSQISLLLLQAVMFAGTAFIDMRFLASQGFDNRKTARKVFFQRARLLYDFDYELDRISLVQALLLMTYWYETPDDQKDTWHWMGVSLSLAHTIGLHRNPENSNLDLKRQQLWKRVWWSCFMRDRLIALGMRRPTRIKNEDCDVPMLTLSDFDTKPLRPELVRMLSGCSVVRDSEKRTMLARLCIEKAKLCVCISHVLAAQYSVLSHKFGKTTETTMMLVPKKATPESSEVLTCDRELDEWYSGLDEDLLYLLPKSGRENNRADGEVIDVHRALLSMVHLTTASALHRPQILPSHPSVSHAPELQDLSRRKVRKAAKEITEIARDLYNADLVRYLPTTGVTVLLPAVIIHLLDIKSSDATLQSNSMRGFYQCMQVLQRLREIYASADFAFGFLEAAIRKANVRMPAPTPSLTQSVSGRSSVRRSQSIVDSSLSPKSNRNAPTLTPPPEAVRASNYFTNNATLTAGELGIISSVATPPGSDRSNSSFGHQFPGLAVAAESETLQWKDFNNLAQYQNGMDVDSMGKDDGMNDFDALINFDGGADLFAAEDGVGVDLDVDWIAGMPGGSNFVKEESVGNGCITGDLDKDLGMDMDE